MRDGPARASTTTSFRTARPKQAVGIKATPKTFEVIHPGEAHPEIRTPVKDAVLFSGGDRLVELTRRVQATGASSTPIQHAG